MPLLRNNSQIKPYPPRKMNIHDVTLTISDKVITRYSDPTVSIRKTRLISQGNFCNVSELKFGSHCGTRIDALSF